MTQPIDDLLTLFQTTYFAAVNTIVTAGGGTEQLTADPTTIMYEDYVDLLVDADPNGYVVLKDEQEAAPVEEGPTRHEPYLIDGFIYYESTDDTSLMIKTIKAKLRSLMNVNNGTIGTYVFKYIGGGLYNNLPQAGQIDFIVEAKLYGVKAYL